MLIQALTAPPLDEETWFEIEPALFEEYNAYYSVDFEAVQNVPMVSLPLDEIVFSNLAPKSQKPVAWALVCHGYYDHMGLYGHLVNELLQRNIAVVGFDQIGHGLSTGAQAIEDFQRYVQVVEIAYKSRSAWPMVYHYIGLVKALAAPLSWRLAQQRFTKNNQPSGEMVLFRHWFGPTHGRGYAGP